MVALTSEGALLIYIMYGSCGSSISSISSSGVVLSGIGGGSISCKIPTLPFLNLAAAADLGL